MSDEFGFMAKFSLGVDLWWFWGFDNIFILTRRFDNPLQSASRNPSKASELYFIILKKMKIGRAGGGRADANRCSVLNRLKLRLAEIIPRFFSS